MNKLTILLVLAGVSISIQSSAALKAFREEMDASAEMFSEPGMLEASEAPTTTEEMEAIIAPPAKPATEADVIIEEELSTMPEPEEDLIMPLPPTFEEPTGIESGIPKISLEK